MDNINDLVNAAMEQWDEETNCGETDPAFAGEVGQEIDSLVDGLNQEKIEGLLKTGNATLLIQEEKLCGFILTCAKCGRQVNITTENERLPDSRKLRAVT